MNALMFFATLKGRLTVAAAIIASIVGLRMWDINHQRGIGESRHAAKVEAATNVAVSKAGTAGRKSANGSGGVLNPYYAD